MSTPHPFDGGTCTRRDHVISKAIVKDDDRRFACDCGLLMVGNGHVEIRFGLLEYLFPATDAPSSGGGS